MATYYINADTGNDGNDGSVGDPWLLFSYAHGQASGGDTIICQDSTATFSFPNLTWAKNLTVQGEQDDASGAVFDGANAARAWTWTGKTCTVEKITFQNIDGQYSAILYLKGASSTVTIKNCIFRDIKAYADSTARGVIGAKDAGTYNNVIIENCLFDDIVARTSGGSFAILTSRNWDVNSSYTIIGSTFYFKDTDYGVVGLFRLVASPNMSVTIKNCIISNETGGTIEFDYADATPDQDFYITYSDFFNISNMPATGTGTITSDPLLVDPVNDNFNLRPASPCIDTGILL